MIRSQNNNNLCEIILIVLLSVVLLFVFNVDARQDRENGIILRASVQELILIAQAETSEADKGEEEEEGEDDEEEEEDEDDEEENILGKELYDAYCARCHGFDGDGKGAASDFTYPTPRDFTSGMFKFHSTLSGDPPTDDDLKRSILVGFPGTSMFGWEGKFSDTDLDALVEYVKMFAEETFEIEGEPVTIGKPPPVSDEMIAVGIKIFDKAKCWECHGKYGRGDGEKGWQPNFKDDWGEKIWPTNLTHPWELRNGSSLEDLFRSVATGLDGTPMPSFESAYSDEERWSLAHFLKSIQFSRKLESTLSLNKADKIPSLTNDMLWDGADYIDLKMEGKKVFGLTLISMITNMRIRGLYTDSEVAIMLEWIDKKPDKGEGGFPPDAVRLQFPVARNLVNLWYWQASDNSVVELNASGLQMDVFIRQKNTDVESVSSYNDGIYRLILKRRLNTKNKNDIIFMTNRHIPFSVIAFDGKNREEGNRGAMSPVRYIILKKP